MKPRKTRVFTALGLVAVSGFSLMAVSFVEAQTKDIKLDPKNAIQTIPVIRFRSDIKTRANYVDLTNTGQMLRIDTKEYNFVLKKGDSDASGTGSTILGGADNNVDGSNYSTIIAGNNNQVNGSSYGTIGGGQGNHVEGSYGTVAGGQNNTARGYSTVVGGSQNNASGNYSVSLGNSNEANGIGSVAMGKSAKVTKDNSFLWAANGATLAAENTFAVMGTNGMVVNTNKAHRFAKLTIGGSLIIEGVTTDASTCNGTTTGVVKVVKGSHNQACFCSCNGSKRNSLYGGGDCSSKCDKSVAPKCDNGNLIKDCTTEGRYSYSGHCVTGEVVEGKGAYMVDKAGVIHWTCQTNDGRTESCTGTVTPAKTYGTCTEPDPDGHCSGGYDTDKAEFVAGSDTGFTGIVEATLYNRLSDVPSGAKCAWYCKDEYYKKGDICAPMEGCDEYDAGDYHVPYMAHGETGTITNNAGTCTKTATCNNGTGSLGAESCYSCQGTPPSGVTSSTVAPTSNTGWFCATDLTQACSYTCPDGWKCKTGGGCQEESHASCKYVDGSPYQCEGSGNITITKTDTTSSTEWKWTCKGEDDTTPKSCSLGCDEGETLTWSSLHNGSCKANEPITINICPVITYNSAVGGRCHTDKTLNDIYYQADRALPTLVNITLGIDWYDLTDFNNCGYSTNEAENLRLQRTINTGSVQTSSPVIDWLHRKPTSVDAVYGYVEYFDSDYDATIDKTSYTDSAGQEYNIVLSTTPCGESTVDGPVCGSANGKNRNSAPSTTAEKCENGTASSITSGEHGWTWTCSKNGMTTNPTCIAYNYPKCGSASGTTVSSMPTGTAACDPGIRALAQTGDSQFTWECGNGGPATVQCSADRTGPSCYNWTNIYTSSRPSGSQRCGEGSSFVENSMVDATTSITPPRYTRKCTNGSTNTDCNAAAPWVIISVANGGVFNNLQQNLWIQFSYSPLPSTGGSTFGGLIADAVADVVCSDGTTSYGKSLSLPISWNSSMNRLEYSGKPNVCPGNITSITNLTVNDVFPSGGPTSRKYNGYFVYFDTWIPTTQSKSCGTSAPSNSSWVKSTFTQTRNGSSWTPSSKTNTCVTSSTSTTECSFICDTNFECDGNTGCKPITYSCTGTGNIPDGVTRSTVAPTSNTGWFCATDLTQACSYKCPDGWKCKTGGGCQEESHASCKYVDGSPYQCEGSGNITITKTDTTSSTEWKWTCKGEDDTTPKSCSLGCDEGETLNWSSLHNGSCASENYYYLSFGLTQHIPERATDIIVYVKDGSGNNSSVPDDRLLIHLRMLSTNGSDFSRDEINVGDASNNSVVDTIPSLLGYKLDDISFSSSNDGEVEIDDSEFVARIGNNIYEIVGFVGEAGQCGKATDEDTITMPATLLCSAGIAGEVLPILKNNKFYWSRKCFGTTDKSCETGIPTAEFNWCNDTSYNYMVVKYSLYNTNFEGSMNFDSNGVVIGDSRTEETLGSANPQTIYSPDITEINSIKYGSNKLPNWSDTYIKNGYAMLAGNYDSSLCTSVCTPRECGDVDSNYQLSPSEYCYSIVHPDDGCGGELTCYINGCAANGYEGYACVAVSELPPTGSACNNAGGLEDVQTVTNDGYRCIMCKGGSCEGELKFDISNWGTRPIELLNYQWRDSDGVEHISPFTYCDSSESLTINADHGNELCSVGYIPCGSYNGGYIHYRAIGGEWYESVVGINVISMTQYGFTYYSVSIDD